MKDVNLKPSRFEIFSNKLFRKSRRFDACLMSLETISSQNGNAGGRHLNLHFYLDFREWPDAFTVSYDTTLQLQHNVCEQGWVPNGNFGFAWTVQYELNEVLLSV